MNKKSILEEKGKKQMTIDPLSGKKRPKKFLTPSDQIQNFNLDRVFKYNLDNETIYKVDCEPLINRTISGYNCTIFTYGQKETGKTHTIRGNADDLGIIQRSVRDILYHKGMHNKEMEISIWASYYEIIGEQINDL